MDIAPRDIAEDDQDLGDKIMDKSYRTFPR